MLVNFATANNCGGKLDVDAVEREFYSPGFPIGKYHANANCTWILTAPEPFTIIMKFEEFQVGCIGN